MTEPTIDTTSATASAAEAAINAYANALRDKTRPLAAAQAQRAEAEAAVAAAQNALSAANQNYKKTYDKTVKDGFPAETLAQIGFEPLAEDTGKARGRRQAKKTPRRTTPIA